MENNQIRAMLAANAPKDIPSWFSQPEGMPPKPQVPSKEGLSEEARREVEIMLKDGDDPTSEEGRQWADKFRSSQRRLEEYERLRKQMLMAQWPWVYADMVLSQQAGPNCEALVAALSRKT